jgi:hypothetical protein
LFGEPVNENLRALVTAYFSDAWPFAVAHGVVVIMTTVGIVRMIWDATAIRRWRPDQPANSGNEITRLLDEFAESVRSLGAKGEHLEVGEHLQRIENATSGRETRLNDTVHWLLLIGIAGTLFGLFEFALRVGSLKQENVVAQVGHILAGAMAKAFPVGFAGVGLLVIFQLFSGRAEAFFDGAVGSAIGRALAYRRETARGRADFIESVAASMQSAMLPLRDLSGVLSESLRPVINEFREQLKEAIDLVRAQSSQVDGYVDRVLAIEKTFTAAAKRLEKSGGALAEFGDTLNARLTAITEQSNAVIRLSDELLKMQRVQHDKFEKLSKLFEVDLDSAAKLTDKVDDVANGVRATITDLKSIPTEVFVALSEEMPRIVDQSAQKLMKSWEGAVEGYSKRLADASIGQIEAMTTTLATSADALRHSVQEWERVDRNVDSLVTNVIREASKQGYKMTQRSLNETRESVELSVREISSEVRSVAGQIEQLLGSVASAMKEAEGALDALRNGVIGLSPSTFSTERAELIPSGTRVDDAPEPGRLQRHDPAGKTPDTQVSVSETRNVPEPGRAEVAAESALQQPTAESGR